MKLYESITNNLRETDMDKLIDNDMTIKELDDTAKWLYDNDRDEWDKFTDNELLELAKLCQYTKENPWGRAYDDEVFDEMDKRGLSLQETENLKEAGTGSNKYVNAYMALSEAIFDGMGDADGWFSFAEALADDYGIKYKHTGYMSDAINATKKGMTIMYEKNPSEFKDYVESLILDSCINDGYFDYLDSKSHKDKEIVKSLQILLEYLQNNGGSQEAIDGITNELNDLSNVQVNARHVGEEFRQYMSDNSFWRVMGTDCRYWTNKDLEGLPSDYACFTGNDFNYLLYRKTGGKEVGLGYGFKNSDNGVIADLLTFDHVGDRVIHYDNFTSLGKSFEITPENKDDTFAKMKRTFVAAANKLKRDHLESYEDYIKSWEYEDTEERRNEYKKHLRDIGIKESQTQEINTILKDLKEKNPNIEKYLNEYYKVIADTEPRPAYDKDNDRMDPAWENWNKTTNNVLYSKEAWNNFTKWVKEKYNENLNESDAYDTNEEARPTPAVDRSGEPYDDGSRIDPRTGERFFGKTVAEEYQAEVDKCLDAYNNKDLDTAYKAWCQLHEILDKRLDSAGPKDDDRFPLYKEWQIYIDKIPRDIMYEITDYGKNKIYAEEYGLKEAEGSKLLDGRYRTMSELRDLFKEYANHFETKGNRIKGNSSEDSYNRGWELGKADAYKLAAFEIENNVDPRLLGESENLKESETGTTSPYVMLEELLKYAERYLSKEISQYCSNYINIKIQKAPDGQYQVVLPNTHEAIDAWLKVHDDKYVAESENLKESYADVANEVKDLVYNVFDGTDFMISGVEVMDDGWITFDVAVPDGTEDGMERSVEIQVPELNYLDAVREKCEEWMSDHDSPDSFYDSENLKEAEEKPKELWVYVSKHGLGPGTIPNDVEAQYVTSLPNTGKDIFSVSRELTPEELDKYELKLFDNSYFARYPEVVKELFELKDE